MWQGQWPAWSWRHSFKNSARSSPVTQGIGRIKILLKIIFLHLLWPCICQGLRIMSAAAGVTQSIFIDSNGSGYWCGEGMGELKGVSFRCKLILSLSSPYVEFLRNRKRSSLLQRWTCQSHWRKLLLATPTLSCRWNQDVWWLWGIMVATKLVLSLNWRPTWYPSLLMSQNELHSCCFFLIQ